MSATADQVLELRRQYKRCKQMYRLEMEALKKADEAAPEAKPVKRVRVRKAERSEKEKANDARLRAITARAKEIRANVEKDGGQKMAWTAAVKAASAEMKA